MQTFKIASLGEGNKSAYDAAGNRYFIPKRFRTDVKVGNYILVTQKSFTSRTDEDGNLVPCDKWTRDEITMVGDFAAITIAKNESAINAGLESAIVSREVKKLAKEFNLDKELEAAAATI